MNEYALWPVYRGSKTGFKILLNGCYYTDTVSKRFYGMKERALKAIEKLKEQDLAKERDS
jgi:hypothetical protein